MLQLEFESLNEQQEGDVLPDLSDWRKQIVKFCETCVSRYCVIHFLLWIVVVGQIFLITHLATPNKDKSGPFPLLPLYPFLLINILRNFPEKHSLARQLGGY